MRPFLPMLALLLFALAAPGPAQDSPTSATLAMGPTPTQTPALPPPAAELPATAASRTPRVAFVDVELVLDTSESIRRIMGEMDDELGRQSRAIDSRKRELARLRAALDEQSAVLAEAERKSRQQKALDMVAQIEEMEFRFQRDAREKQRTTIEPLLEAVIGVVSDVARRENFDLVVRGEIVLYGASTCDLTGPVIRELDRRESELRQKLKAAPKPTPTSALPMTP